MTELPNHSFTFTELPSNVHVGKFSSIASDCSFHRIDDEHLVTTNHNCVYTYNWDQPYTSPGEINIGNDVWIGRAVRVLPNLTIGNGAIVGAGAVIAKDIPPYAVVVGNPQVIKRIRFTPEQIEKLEKIAWWDWDIKLIDERRADLKDINSFLQKYG